MTNEVTLKYKLVTYKAILYLANKLVLETH